MKRRILTIACCLTCILGIHAQGEAGALSLSLDQAKQYAIDHNRSLQNASLQVREAEAQRWQAIASMLPQVDGTLSYNNMMGYKLKFGSTGMSMEMPPYGSLGITASVAVNGQLVMNAIISKLAIDMQQVSLDQTEQQILANVTQIYTAILAMEQVSDLLQESLKNIEQLQGMTQRAADVGTVEQTSADQIQVRVGTLKNNINSTLRSTQIYRNSLKLLLGLSNHDQIQLTQTLDDVLNAETTLSLLGTDFDIERNYNWQLLQKSTDLSKKQVTAAWMAYTPTLSLAYQYSGQKYFSDTEGFRMTPPNTFVATLSVPLFSSLSRAAGVRQKKLAYQEALNTQDDTRDQLMVQNDQLRFNLINSFETYTNEKENIDVTSRVFESTSNKYKQGVASTQDLITASNDLISAQSTYIQSVLTLVQSQVELETFLNK
ncbi:MAG: TolC family protein [Paludibacteraceae bacterium]|nr:TolC family protein [Paludibacteraceae bacterium]